VIERVILSKHLGHCEKFLIELFRRLLVYSKPAYYLKEKDYSFLYFQFSESYLFIFKKEFLFMAEISIDIASQLISNYIKIVIDKATQGKKLSNQEYLILLVYYNIMYIDRRFAELKDYTDKRFEELKQYIDKRFDDVDRRFVEMKDYTDKRFQEIDKRFESLENEVKELRKEVNDIKAKIATIETRLDNMEKEMSDLKDLMKQMLALMTQLVSVLASKQ